MTTAKTVASFQIHGTVYLLRSRFRTRSPSDNFDNRFKRPKIMKPEMFRASHARSNRARRGDSLVLQQQPSTSSDRPSIADFETATKPESLDTEAATQTASAAVEELLAALAVEQRKRQQLTRRFRAWLGLVLGIVCTLILIIAVKTEKWMVLSSLTCLAALGASVAASSRQKQVLASLAQFRDLRTVGPLAEALEYGDEEIVPIAEEALSNLLPQLTASDTELLSTRQRECLHHVLIKAYATQPALALTILKAFEQVGDERDLATVERLAKGGGRAAREPEVRKAAEACLPYVQQRADAQFVRQSLLRPSNPAAMPSTVLLRPAVGVATHDPLELLRACPINGRTMTEEQAQLAFAILSDLEAARDPRALPYVSQLAASHEAPPRLREAAQRCESVLISDHVR
jgi:hypothetical protein